MTLFFAKTTTCDFSTNHRNRILINCCLIIMLLTPVFLAGTAHAETQMTHSTPDYFISGHRIQLEAEVSDSDGVKLVRCYFKAVGEADLVFVPMNLTGKNEYAGVLPAPSDSTTQIEYLFLSVNNSNQVVRSQTFTITKDANEDEPPAWQEVPKEGEIRVSMELDKVPTELRGFSDNVTIDMVESGARFGVVALLYHTIRDSDSAGSGAAGSGAGTGATAGTSSAAVASATAATGATSAGIITAGAAGWSTAAIVGVGLGVAAVGGGTAAAVSASSDDDDDDDNTNSGPAEDLSEQTILDFWNVTGSHPDGRTAEGNITFNENGTYSYFLSDSGNGNGEWTLSGTNLTLNFDAGAIYNGIASGDSDAFRMDSTNNGWTLNFTR